MSNDKLAQVFHFDLYGKREQKYNFLNNNSLESIDWNTLVPGEPDYFFSIKDFTTNSEYFTFFKVSELFNKYSAGIQTKRDALFIDDSLKKLENRISTLINETLESSFIKEFNILDSSSYKLTEKIKKVKFIKDQIKLFHYRPFDDKYIYYDPSLIGRSFYPVMRNLMMFDNIGLVISKQFIDSFKYTLFQIKFAT